MRSQSKTYLARQKSPRLIPRGFWRFKGGKQGKLVMVSKRLERAIEGLKIPPGIAEATNGF